MIDRAKPCGAASVVDVGGAGWAAYSVCGGRGGVEHRAAIHVTRPQNHLSAAQFKQRRSDVHGYSKSAALHASKEFLYGLPTSDGQVERVRCRLLSGPDYPYFSATKIVSSAQHRLRTRRAEHGGAQQSRDHRGEIKPTVEPVLALTEVQPCVLGVRERMVAAADRPLCIR